MKTLFDHVERLLNYLFPSLEETSSKVTDIPWLRKCARYAPLITFLILGVIFLFLPIAAGGIFSVLFFLIAAFWYGLFGAAIKFLKKKKRDYSIVKLLFPVFSLKFLFVFTVFLMLHISLHTKIDDHEKFMQEMESRREKDPSTHGATVDAAIERWNKEKEERRIKQVKEAEEWKEKEEARRIEREQRSKEEEVRRKETQEKKQAYMAEFNRKRREDLRKWWESGHKEFSAKEQSQKNPERSVTILDIPFYTEKNFEDWLAEVEREKAEKKNKLVEAEPTKTE